MTKQVLFIQGGGNAGYAVDTILVKSLKQALGPDYDVRYPEIKPDETAPDFGWPSQIGEQIDKLEDGLVLVAHSVGASLLLKYLSENKVAKKIAGIFLLATPFWNGDEEWKRGLKLNSDFARHLPKNVPIYFYHNPDDEEVPFDNLNIYREKLPTAIFREKASNGHQFNNDLTLVAADIKRLLNGPNAD